MTRIAIPPEDQIPEASRPLLDQIERRFGFVPNVFRLISISPAALAALSGLAGPLGRTLDARTRERIALAIAEANGCHYCVSGHSQFAARLGLSPHEIARNRAGGSNDPAADAAVRFATRVVERRGDVSDDDLVAVRTAGYTDAQIVEIVALVIQYFFTNFVNNVAHTPIDFPDATDVRAA